MTLMAATNRLAPPATRTVMRVECSWPVTGGQAGTGALIRPRYPGSRR